MIAGHASYFNLAGDTSFHLLDNLFEHQFALSSLKILHVTLISALLSFKIAVIFVDLLFFLIILISSIL